MATLKLSDVQEDPFVLELKDGTIRELDPWDLADKIDQPDKASKATFDTVREAFGLPKLIDAKEKGETLTNQQCVAIQAALLEHIANNVDVKRINAVRDRLFKQSA